MSVELNYQLNCNENHDICYFFRIRESMTQMYIYRYTDTGIDLYVSIPLSVSPISSGWINNSIYILFEYKLLLLDVQSQSFDQLCLPEYKIADMIRLYPDNSYIYSAIVDSDVIDFYRKTKDNIDIKVASFYIERRELRFSDVFCSSSECEKIKEYVNEVVKDNENNISDTFDNHVLKIKHLPLYSKLLMNEECLGNFFGYIDRAFFFGDKIIYTISSFFSASSVKMIGWNAVELGEFDENVQNDSLLVTYCSEETICMYHYMLYNKTKQNGIIVMLHGGPAGRYSNCFDPMAFSFVQAGFMVYLLNYPGSTGYGEAYRKMLYGNGGTVDCNMVIDSIKKLRKKFKDIPLYLIGDSYGGYLAILTLLKSGDILRKAYATNAFTDIRHQFLFSRARSVIVKYFPDICSSQIQRINPIDLVHSGQLKGRLLIINGINDLYCPKEQVIQFVHISGCEMRLMSDYPHYKVDYAETDKISNIIMQDIGEQI